DVGLAVAIGDGQARAAHRDGHRLPCGAVEDMVHARNSPDDRRGTKQLLRADPELGKARFVAWGGAGMDKSRRDFVSGTGLVGLGMIASGPFSSRAWAAGEPIELGWVGPLSPPGNYSGGQEMKWAVQQKADEINKAGGILGRPIEVFYEDTKGQPAE